MEYQAIYKKRGLKMHIGDIDPVTASIPKISNCTGIALKRSLKL
jgi:hypothetical protein